MFCAPWTSPDLSSIKSAWRPSPQQEEWPQLCPATVKFRDALQQEATATVLWWPVLPAGWLLLLFGTLLILCQITLSSYKYKINFFFFLIYAGQLQNDIPGQSIKIVNSRKENFSQSYRFVVCIHVHVYVLQLPNSFGLSPIILCALQRADYSICLICWFLNFFSNLKSLHQPYEYKTKGSADRLQKTVKHPEMRALCLEFEFLSQWTLPDSLPLT